jgi:hypothetical protein
VQVIARQHSEDGRTPDRPLLVKIATDPRLADAVGRTGGRTDP